jgi:hypothetical protein
LSVFGTNWMRKLFTFLCLCLIGGWVYAAAISQTDMLPGSAQAQPAWSQAPCHEHTAPALASHASPCKSDVHTCCHGAFFFPTLGATRHAVEGNGLLHPFALSLETGLRRERVYKPPRFTLPV